MRRRAPDSGADKACDTADFVEQVRQVDMTAYVAHNDTRSGGSVIDAPTTRHPGRITAHPNDHTHVPAHAGWAACAWRIAKFLNIPAT
jgi:hypothetical protein